jgi:hypothetical protein
MLAAGVGAVAVPAPARADVCGDYQVCSPSPDTLVKLGFALFKIGKGGLTESALETLLLEIVGLMHSAENEVIVHFDNAQVQAAIAAMTTLLIEAESYPQLRDNEILLWNLYDKALTTVNNSKAAYNTVSDRKGKDDIARAILVDYPVTFAAIGDWDQQFGPSGNAVQIIQDGYINTLRDFRAQLEPQCHTQYFPPAEGSNELSAYEVCVAATGREASRFEHWVNGELTTPPVNIPLLQREAAIGSAWLEAVQTLEQVGL